MMRRNGVPRSSTSLDPGCPHQGCWPDRPRGSAAYPGARCHPASRKSTVSLPEDTTRRVVRVFKVCVDALYGLALIALAPVVYAENPRHFYVALAAVAVGLFGLVHAYRVFTGRPGCPVEFQPVYLVALGAALFSRGVWLWAGSRQWANGAVSLSIGAVGVIGGWRLRRKRASRNMDGA